MNPANGHLVVKSTDPELAKSTQVASKMVVVCDVSGSMRGNIVKCKRAAAAVVHTANAAQLPQGTVYIVFFDHNIQLCVDATDSDAVEQIGLARTGGGTKYGPVIKLLQVQEPSSVLFITDGVPQDAQDAYALIDTFAKQTSAVVLPVFFAPEGTYATSMTPRAMQVLKRLACNTDQDPKVVEDCDKLVELIEQSIWAAGQDQTGAISVDDGVPMLARVFGNGEATIVVTMQPVTNFAPTSQVALEIGGQRIPCVVTDAAPDHTTQQLIETTTLVSMLDQANNALHCRAPDALAKVAAALRLLPSHPEIATRLKQLEQALVTLAETPRLLHDPLDVITDPNGLCKLMEVARRRGLWDATLGHGQGRKVRRVYNKIVALTLKSKPHDTNKLKSLLETLGSKTLNRSTVPEDEVVTYTSIDGYVIAILAGPGQNLRVDPTNNLLLAAVTNPAATGARQHGLMGLPTYKALADNGLKLARQNMPFILFSDGSDDARDFIRLSWRRTALALLADTVGFAQPAASSMWPAIAFSLLLNDPGHAELATVAALQDYFAAGGLDPKVLTRAADPLGVVMSNVTDHALPNVGLATVVPVFTSNFAEAAAAPTAAVCENARLMFGAAPTSGDALVAAFGTADVVPRVDHTDVALLNCRDPTELLGALKLYIDPDFALPVGFIDQCWQILADLNPRGAPASAYVLPAAVSWTQLADVHRVLAAMPTTAKRHANGGYLPDFTVPEPLGDNPVEALKELGVTDDTAVLMTAMLVNTGGNTTRLRALCETGGPVRLSNALLTRLLPALVEQQQRKYWCETLQRLALCATPEQLCVIITTAQVAGAIDAVASALLRRDKWRPSWEVFKQLLSVVDDAAPFLRWIHSNADAAALVKVGVRAVHLQLGMPLRAHLVECGIDEMILQRMANKFLARNPANPCGRGHRRYSKELVASVGPQGLAQMAPGTPITLTNVTPLPDSAHWYSFSGNPTGTLFDPAGLLGGTTAWIFTIHRKAPVLIKLVFADKTVSRDPDGKWPADFLKALRDHALVGRSYREEVNNNRHARVRTEADREEVNNNRHVRARTEVAYGAFVAISPSLGGIGVASLFCSFFVGLYYTVIISWKLLYLFDSFRSALPWDGYVCDNMTAGVGSVPIP